MSFTTYQFPLEDINGPMVDSNEQVVFIISTTWGLLKGGPTTVTRPDGTVMGEIQLQPLWFPSKVTIHGNEVKDFMDWGGDGVVVFSAKSYKFKDGDGKEFYWKDDTVSSLYFSWSLRSTEFTDRRSSAMRRGRKMWLPNTGDKPSPYGKRTCTSPFYQPNSERTLTRFLRAASLAVNDAYLPSIDYILLSALLVALKHKSKERRGVSNQSL